MRIPRPTAEDSITHDKGVWYVHGDLSFRRVTPLAMQARTLWDNNQRPTRIELGKIGKVDSAGLALLLQWRGWQRDDELVFHNIPDQMKVLAELHGVSDLLKPCNPPLS